MTRFELDGATLVLGTRTLWLERPGTSRVRATPLRYDQGRLRDHIVVGNESFAVPRGRGSAAMLFLASHRLPEDGSVESVRPSSGPFIEERTPVETLWLDAWLADGEILLAFLHTATDVEIESALGPAQTVQARFVLTDRRALFAAVGPLGDAQLTPVDALTVEARTGRDRLVAGESTWTATLGNEDSFAALAPQLAAGPSARLRFTIDAARATHPEAARALLAHLDGPRAPVERALLEGQHPTVDDAFVEALGPDGIVAWADGWQLTPAVCAQLVTALRERDPESPHALALGEALWQRSRADDPIGADVDRAAHLRTAGAEAEARAVLEAGLSRLPDPEVAELVPSDDPHAHVRDRIRLLEALVPLDPNAHHSLARIEPFADGRLAALEARGDARGQRAARLRAVLDGALEAPAEVESKGEAMDGEALEAFRHPMSRTNRFASTLQGLVASVEVPNHGALRRFCAPLEEPRARAAFDAARERLGVDAQCYVSRGELSTGCRAYDDPAGPFVVLGGRHLESGVLHLPLAALRFVFACELAHLRFGHARVTSSDLWQGAIDKGLGGADLLLTALPLVRQVRVPDAVGTMLGVVRDGTVGKLWDKASSLFGKDDEPEPSDEEQARESLLATHRLMELSADRVGLALVTDPGPAVQALLALRGAVDVQGAQERGLRDWVLRRTSDGTLVDPDLAVRTTALFARYLDGDGAS